MPRLGVVSGVARPDPINRNPGDASRNDAYAMLDQLDKFRRPKKLVVGLQKSPKSHFWSFLDTPETSDWRPGSFRSGILVIFVFCAPSRSCLGAARPDPINRNPGDTSRNDDYAMLDQSDKFRRPKKLVDGLVSGSSRP